MSYLSLYSFHTFRLTTSFFGVYIPRYRILSCHVLLCYLGLHLLHCVYGRVYGYRVLWYIKSSNVYVRFVVSSNTIIFYKFKFFARPYHHVHV